MHQHRLTTRSVNRTASRPLDGPPDDWAVLPFPVGEDGRSGVVVRT